MSQEEVIKVLSRSSRSLSSREITKRMGIAFANVSRNIRGLVNQNLLVVTKTKIKFSKKPIFVYKLK